MLKDVLDVSSTYQPTSIYICEGEPCQKKAMNFTPKIIFDLFGKNQTWYCTNLNKGNMGTLLKAEGRGSLDS